MATNHIDIQDPSLPRRERIDRKIELPNPNEDVSLIGGFLDFLGCIIQYSC